jgi:MFS family permease
LSLATTLAAVYAAWVCLGLAIAATLYVPVFAVVTRRFPTDYRRRTITLTFLGGLASTVFIPLMAWLLNALGWRGPSAGHMRHPTSTAPHAAKPCANPRLCWWGCFRC